MQNNINPQAEIFSKQGTKFQSIAKGTPFVPADSAVNPVPFYRQPTGPSPASPIHSHKADPLQKKPSLSQKRRTPSFHGAHLSFQDSQTSSPHNLPLEKGHVPSSLLSSPLVTAKDYCQKAQELLNQRQWKSAQTVLQRGLLEVEKTATAYHLLGLAFYHQGLFQQALIQIEKACDANPQPEYFLNLSLILNEIGRYQPAREAYAKAERLKSQSSEQNWRELVTKRHNQTAEAYLQNHQLKPALKEYIKGLEFYPQPSAQLQIAHLLWKLNQKTTAEKYLKSFISLNPQNTEARLLLASWYFEQEQIPQATHEWETVLRMDPKNQSAYNCLLKVQQMSEW